MNKLICFLAVFFLVFQVSSGKVLATCAGSYDCAAQDGFGNCTTTFSGGGFCSGPNNACSGYAAVHCSGGCVLNNECRSECSYSACSPSDGHSCPAGSLWIDIGGTGQTSCTGSTGCFTSPSCPGAPTSTPPAGCGTCGGCTPACGSSCQGVCSGNGQSCTITGPACGGPTNTPAPNCTIQGRKVIMPGNQQIAPAIGQTVSLVGGGSTTSNPFSFAVVGGSKTVSVTNISGYDTGYTLCNNVTTCHGGSITPGDAVTFSCPVGGFSDLYWHFCPAMPAPSGLSPSGTIACGTTSVTLNWNDVPNAVDYWVAIDDLTASAGWNGSCSSPLSGDACAIVSVSQWARTIAAGHSFQWMALARNSCGGFGPGAWTPFNNICVVPTNTTAPTPVPPTATPVPCTLTLSPVSLSLNIGGTGAVSGNLVTGLGSATISSVTFSTSNAAVASRSPATDSASPFSTTITGVSAGVVTITGVATLSDARTCSTTGATDTTVTVAAPTLTPTPTPIPSCSITVPNVTMPASSSLGMGVTINSETNGSIDRMTFTSSNTARVTVTSPDTTGPAWGTTLTSTASTGTATVTVNAYMNGNTTIVRCTDSSTITVTSGPTLTPAPTATPTPTGVLTPTPTPTTVPGNTWTITTAPTCSAGGGVTAQLRMFHYLGPTAAPVYTEDALASGNHVMSITSTLANDVVWVGMKDSGGTSLQTMSIAPADADVTFGQDFTPAVWTAQWDRALLPVGSYTVTTQMTPTAPGSPTANTNPVAGTQVTLNWSAPSSWGIACSPNNTYDVYFSQEAAGYSGYPNNAAPSPAPNFTCNSSACTGTPSTTTASTSTTFTISAGLRYCWAVVANNGNLDGPPSNFRCFDATSGPWWQAAGGDVVGATSVLDSALPAAEFLIEQIGGGRPGVAFGESLGSGLNASTNVNVNDWWSDLTGFDWSAVLSKPETKYRTMRDRILFLANPPISSSPLQLWSGGSSTGVSVVINGLTYWVYRANAPVTVQGLNSSVRRVILMVDGVGNTTLGDNLTFTSAGFALILAEGDIVVQPNVISLQGIYFAGGEFDMGVNSNVLTVDGTVVGMNGVTLGRTGGGTTNPSEIFNFRPDYAVALNDIGLRKKVVQELVNP